MGIEPTSKAWEALILPMNYARLKIIITSLKSLLCAGNGNRIPANAMSKSICSKAWENCAR